jgi:GAF domain-containing protein
VPLTTPDGGRLGAICILDRQPGKPLREDQQELLNGLSQLAMSLVTRTPTANAA